MTWVSQRKPSGNSGRIGRSIWRLVRISRSLGTSFALDESARNASGGVGVFTVINGERKEVDALARIGVGAGGGENLVVANARRCTSRVPAWLFSGFKVNGFTAVQLYCYFCASGFIYFPFVENATDEVPGPLRP